MSIALNIKILRTEHGMTYEQFAKLIDINPRSLRRWESGERCPTIGSIKIIIDTFHIENIYEFMYGKQSKPKELIPKLMYVK